MKEVGTNRIPFGSCNIVDRDLTVTSNKSPLKLSLAHEGQFENIKNFMARCVEAL